MTVTIARATLDDLDDLAGLFDQYRAFYNQPSNPTGARSFLKQRIANGESVLFVGRTERAEASGFVQLYPTFSSQSMQRMWILNDLYVAESFRRRGVAEQLLEAAEQFAIASSAKGLLLCTQVTNRNAQALYAKCGYEPVSEFQWYFLRT